MTADYAQVEKISQVKVEEQKKEVCSDSEFQVVTNKRNKNNANKTKKKRKSKKKKKRCNSESAAPLVRFIIYITY